MKFWTKLSEEHKWLITIVGVVIAFVGFSLLVGGIAQSCSNRQIQKKSAEFNANIAEQTNSAKEVNANISNLEKLDAAKTAETNIRREDLENAKSETNQAQTNTNTALENVNKIRNSNRSGVTAEELKKKSKGVY